MSHMIRRKVTGTVYRVLDQVRDDRTGAAFDAWWIQDGSGIRRKVTGQDIARNYENAEDEPMPALSRDLIYGAGAQAALEFVENQSEGAEWTTHDLARVIIDAVWDRIKESTE